MFETEGWKRIPGCLRFMKSFGLNPEHFELVAEKVIHPNSRGFDRFLEELYDDLNCEVSSKLTNQKLGKIRQNYFVSFHQDELNLY